MKKHCILEILSSRVRRNYSGGVLLDELEGETHPADGDRPEDWIASTTEARNPGLLVDPGEGRFRRPDWICCLECYKGRNSICSGKKSELAESQDA